MKSPENFSVSENSPQTWLFLKSGLCEPAFNMAMDEALLEAMPRLQKPVLRFYGWTEPASSFGYFQKFSEIEKLTMLRPLVRRPTAGGLVPHDADWTYSVAFPTNHEWYFLRAIESYRRIHEWLQSAFVKLQIESELAPCCMKSAPGQCFIGYEHFDLLWRGKKIAGAAQRRTRDGLLIQGSVQPPPVSPDRDSWETAMLESSSASHWENFSPDISLRDRADELGREKYSQPSYNQKR